MEALYTVSVGSSSDGCNGAGRVRGRHTASDARSIKHRSTYPEER